MTSTRSAMPGVALLIVLLAACGQSVEQPQQQPNILVVMLDDFGYNDLAINNNNPDIDTPNLDQISREGMRFTRHYAAASCSPARAAFLSGMYPERLGYLPNGPGISPQVLTLPERLRELGYHTRHYGKWHIGHIYRDAWPDRQGFDEWLGYLSQFHLGGAKEDGSFLQRASGYNKPWLQGSAEPGRFFKGHLEDIMTDQAIEAITDLNTQDAPWFLNLWYYAPHRPIQPSREFAQRYPDTEVGRYQALVNQLDSNVGRLIAHLDKVGAGDNTIVVVVSDNGGTNRELDNNAPFRGSKVWLMEGALRTPLIIRWPDQALNGQVYSDIVAIEDIYPTLMDAIGSVVPEDLDGSSFYADLTGEGSAVRKPRLRKVAGDGYTLLSADGRWRLHRISRTWDSDSPPLLYDLETDPAASAAMALPPQDRIAEFRREFLDWNQDIHTVQTRFERRADGTGELTGMDFMRTPGIGGYTIGFAVPARYEGLLAAQGGAWDIERQQGTITARFGELKLTGSLVGNAMCHSVVVSGDFERRIALWSEPERISLTLWIDGKEADSASWQGVLPIEDPATPTRVGDTVAEAEGVALPPPVILNTALHARGAWPVSAFAASLCPRS